MVIEVDVDYKVKKVEIKDEFEDKLMMEENSLVTLFSN